MKCGMEVVERQARLLKPSNQTPIICNGQRHFFRTMIASWKCFGLSTGGQDALPNTVNWMGCG